MRLRFLIIAFCTHQIANSQPTIGVTQYDSPNTDGYVLFSGISSTQTYLIDKCGRMVNQWSSAYRPGLSVDLLPDGNLFRTGSLSSPYFGTGGGKGGVLELYSWSGNLLWSFVISDSNQCQHHDAIVLPSGNILAVVWERKTSAQALQAGKNPSVTAQLTNQEVWSEKIIELQPVGSDSAILVWEWKAWDHLVQDIDAGKDNFGVVNQHPELLNLNYVTQGPPGNPDWLHINSIDYDSANDQILLSSHSFSEFWIIDHSTSTLEAASHTGGNSGKGGDVLYRWGNPVTYGRGTTGDQKLFKQHHASYIKPGYLNAGKVLVFNNGVNRPGGNYTSIDMVDIAQAGRPFAIGATSPYLPNANFWTYTAPVPASFYATNIGGVYALPNGSFLITDGPKGEFFEIDSLFEVKWRYTNPVNNTGPMNQGTTPSSNTVFRAVFYEPSYPAFASLTVTPTTEIELNPTTPSLCSVATGLKDKDVNVFSVYPNPCVNSFTLGNFVADGNSTLSITDINGRVVLAEKLSTSKVGVEFLSRGLYFGKLVKDNGNQYTFKFVKE